MTNESPIQEGQTLTGPLFNEPMRVETVRSGGDGSWTLGLVGLQSEQFRRVTLTRNDLETLKILDSIFTYDGDGNLLRLGLQAYALGIAYEFDHYFGLSISRVDPLPHQLEAVYDYLLKLARVRFLLADDAGAGKTIMAGLLIRELQLRGLADRILIVCPSNLSFQWQRELKEKFLEERLLRNVDEGQFRAICQNALEGLASKKLNLEMLVERRAKAQECRVVPETIARFIREASVFVPFELKTIDHLPHTFEPARTPPALKIYEHHPGWKYPLLANRYPRCSTDRETAEKGNLEWVTPGHPFFEALRQHISEKAVERITSVLVLPHPEREAPDIRHIRPNLETEAIAMQTVMEWEKAQSRQVFDVHEKNLGYDITSLDLNSGELRLIEIKGLAAATGTILLSPNERRVAEDRRDCYWLYVVTNCLPTKASAQAGASEPVLQTPIKDPVQFHWHEVTKVAHYWLEVNAMTKPMQVREKKAPYGESQS